MKTITLNVSDTVENMLKEYIDAGVFKSEEDIFHAAIAEFVRNNRLDLIEKFAKEDIDWAF
jgi:hypothetical protein